MGIKLYIWWESLKDSLSNQKGQGMVEYGLILVAVALAALVALKLIGTNLSTMFNDAAGNLTK